jgi:hypothetical protein
VAQPGQRPDIEGKISLIADRLVRGQDARADKSIILSRFRAATAIIASTLTTMGLANPLISLAAGRDDQKLSAVFDAFFGLPKIFSFVGVAIFIITAIGLAFYRQAKVDEKAVQSLALSDAFDRLEIELFGDLELAEPIQQLNVRLNSAKTLESSNYQIMPKRNDANNLRINNYVKKKIDEYCKFWGDSLPDSDRKEKA